MAVPAAPANLVAAPGDNKLTVSWDAVTATPAVDHYEYRKGTSGGWKSDGVALAVVVDGLANGKQYTIQVRAVNADGNGAVGSVTGTPADVNPANDNGFDDATVFANPGAAVGHLDFNDPDD